jgi:fluoroacetyl-CoA thioesterase
MPNQSLQPGLIFRRSIVVDQNLTVPCVARAFVGFADMPAVFATVFMVGLMEWTCVEGLRPYLLEGEHTVGTFIDVSHIAATPVGMRVTAEARLLAAVGRKFRFRVVCHDEHELVGEGSHERTLIRKVQFMSRAEAKRTRIAASETASERAVASPKQG